ncbi:MAG: hypothetical protein ABIT38_10665 [Gemmatimonadaceae bacterium]
MKTTISAALLALGLTASISLTPVLTTQSDQSSAQADPDLKAVRAATERFRDVKVAVAEGYIRDPMNICDTAEMMGQPAKRGVMGVHYIRPDYLEISGPPSPRVDGKSTHTDFLKPAVLIYEPQKDGTLQLVAVENLVFIKAWEAAGHKAPPSFHGVVYNRMVDDPATKVDEAHMFEPHYDRHVWIYRNNPNGMYAQFNPNVTCKYHAGGEHKHQ